MSSFIEYGPLTKSSSFTLGNLSVKNFRNAFASAAGSGLSAAIANCMAPNESIASARAAEARWIADRTFTSPLMAFSRWAPFRRKRVKKSRCYPILAVMVSLAPLLSTQLIFRSSPFLAPLKLNLT